MPEQPTKSTNNSLNSHSTHVHKKRWVVTNEYSSQTKEDIITLLLKNRGLTTEEQIKNFLNPPRALELIQTTSTPFKQSLLKAKKLILEAIQTNTPIVIHGDYDADGICATSILFNTISKELKYPNCQTFIPNRFEHGYGLSIKSIDSIINQQNKPKKLLIITVDCGITSAKEVDYIKSKGYQVIITDHHQKPQDIPQADCLVWEDALVGSGIAWVLAKTLGSKDQTLVSLAALATVTDLQPLFGINRSIVKEGLDALNSNPPLGLKKLLQLSGRGEGEVTTYDLGWVLGPRLNAAGRMLDASVPLVLLTSENDEQVEQAALSLNKTNIERQDKTEEMYILAGTSTGELPKIIVSANSEYHEGIIGLVSAKLTQRYYRPSIVIALSESQGKGSARSIPGIDIISILRQHEDLFINLGGHPMAAGFTILQNNIQLLEQRLVEFTKNLAEELFEPILEIDLKIPITEVNTQLSAELTKLKPFGVGNREPVFLTENLGIASMNIVGREKTHLSFRFYAGGMYFGCIMFNKAELASEFKPGDMVDVVYKIKESQYNGNKKLDLIIEDIRKNKSSC